MRTIIVGLDNIDFVHNLEMKYPHRQFLIVHHFRDGNGDLLFEQAVKELEKTPHFLLRTGHDVILRQPQPYDIVAYNIRPTSPVQANYLIQPALGSNKIIFNNHDLWPERLEKYVKLETEEDLCVHEKRGLL